MVVRNGKPHHERTVYLGPGPVSLSAPGMNDGRPKHLFSRRILPPGIRRSPCLEEPLPLLYPHDLSTADFSEALNVLLGSQAAGFSTATVAQIHWNGCTRSGGESIRPGPNAR